MAWLELDDNKKLYYEEFGAEKENTIIFLNGIVYSTASWYFQKKGLRDRFHIVSYDMRCQGKSTKETEQFDYTLHVEDLEKLMKHLAISSATIVGISYGSFVAKQFAVRYPELLEKLVLLVPVRKVDFVTSLVYSNWQALLERDMLKEFYDLALYMSYSDMRKYQSAAIYQKSFEKFSEEFDCSAISKLLHSFDIKTTFKNYHEIKTPTLVVGAEFDALHNPQDAEKIHKEISGSRLLMMPTGHAVNIEDYEGINNAIADFVLTG